MEREAGEERHDERAPAADRPAPKTDDELVDEASIDSFPASDPPSFWGGRDAGPRR